MTYSRLIDAALIFAATAHREQVRKGTGTPYIVHPVGVMVLLMQAGETDPELLAAALLHDTLEDAGVTGDALRVQFGPRVAEIVEGASEPYSRDEVWETRKQHTVAYLRTAPRAVQLVAAADKLHNLKSMVVDHAALGEALWTRFNRGRPNIAWYYRSISVSLSAGDLRDHPVVAQLAETVEQFFGTDAQENGEVKADMPTRTLETSIEIEAPAAQVWRVFVEPALTRQMGGEYVSDWTPGAPFGWRALDGQMLTSGVILKIEPERLLQHSLFNSVAAAEGEPAITSVITYTLHEAGGRTTLAAREEFSQTIDDAAYADALAGWEAALQAVKAVAETPA